MSCYLPNDVILQILYNLPVKKLVQCMCVCKTWHGLIKSPTFIYTQRERRREPSPLLLFRACYRKQEHYTLYRDDQELNVYKNLHFPFDRVSKSYFFVVASCNGLVCLTDSIIKHTDTFIFWNPSIQRSVTLPKPLVSIETHGEFEAFIGFGFDSHSNDFKVLRIVKFLKHYNYLDYLTEVELYSLASNSWKSIPVLPPFYDTFDQTSQALVNGIIHFLTFRHRREGGYLGFYILGFDLHNETFCKNLLPESFDETVCSVWAYKESTLAIIGNNIGDDGLPMERMINIWIMKEYGVADSWTKICSFDDRNLKWILLFRQNGELLVKARDGEVYSYDPEKQENKKIVIHNWRPDCYFLDFYVESLVLLDRV